jgi:hypothetical protein
MISLLSPFNYRSTFRVDHLSVDRASFDAFLAVDSRRLAMRHGGKVLLDFLRAHEALTDGTPWSFDVRTLTISPGPGETYVVDAGCQCEESRRGEDCWHGAAAWVLCAYADSLCFDDVDSFDLGMLVNADGDAVTEGELLWAGRGACDPAGCESLRDVPFNEWVN